MICLLTFILALGILAAFTWPHRKDPLKEYRKFFEETKRAVERELPDELKHLLQ